MTSVFESHDTGPSQQGADTPLATNIIKLGSFKVVSRPDLRRNDDLSLSVNPSGPATISVNVNHPYDVEEFKVDAARLE